MVDEKIFLAVFLLDPKEVRCLLEDLTELDVFPDGKLARNAAFVGTLKVEVTHCGGPFERKIILLTSVSTISKCHVVSSLTLMGTSQGL